MENVGTKKIGRVRKSAIDVARHARSANLGTGERCLRHFASFAVALFVAWGWANHYYVATMQVIVARERSNPTVTGQQNATVGNDTNGQRRTRWLPRLRYCREETCCRKVVQVCDLAKNKTPPFWISEQVSREIPRVKKAREFGRRDESACGETSC